MFRVLIPYILITGTILPKALSCGYYAIRQTKVSKSYLQCKKVCELSSLSTATVGYLHLSTSEPNEDQSAQT